ncbi:hypothetical protein [Rufibacter hautae]|uniref:DUF4369 domain-containing protein n=1 Tax=Rufibacter hautae TaxID=2595005 RepID=A0A5B6T8Y4_9BACT|nr:hypothetical protein [Rufibacter hautae]KAA3436445.1 hypothetical protein FOA19_18820 [Rufibacter hautae]
MNPNKLLWLVLLLIACTSIKTSAQVYLEEVNGRPIRINQYVNVEGSPFLQEDFSKGTITLPNGTTHKDVELKFDMVEGLLQFKNKHGIVMELTQPVSSFSINYSPDKITEQTRTFVSGQTVDKNALDNTFYEVLSTGPVSLLKRDFKVIREDKAFNSATVTKRIAEVTIYYLKQGDELTKIKNEEKSVLSALKNKKDTLKGYITANKLNLKNDKDLTQLINYYNTI